MQENDEPLLELLEDVKITFSEKNPMGFTLHFHFAKNDFFTNSVLTKQVHIIQHTWLVKMTDESEIYFFSMTWSACRTQRIHSVLRVLRSSSVWVAPLTGCLARTSLWSRLISLVAWCEWVYLPRNQLFTTHDEIGKRSDGLSFDHDLQWPRIRHMIIWKICLSKNYC